jgi:hypothetical protein
VAGGCFGAHAMPEATTIMHNAARILSPALMRMDLPTSSTTPTSE